MHERYVPVYDLVVIPADKLNSIQSKVQVKPGDVLLYQSSHGSDLYEVRNVPATDSYVAARDLAVKKEGSDDIAPLNYWLCTTYYGILLNGEIHAITH